MANIQKNTIIDDTGYLRLPVGTTAERTGTPVIGDTRINSSRGLIEFYNGSAWVGIGQYEASGGNSVTTAGGYRIHTFTSPGALVGTGGSATAEILVIAGGGSGGSGTGGGGGAGGVIYNSSFALSPGTYSVVVGAGGPFRPGGVTQGISGSPSVFGPQTAIGGGYGGNTGPGIMNPAASGGSGGGHAGYPGSPQGYSGTVAAGTPGQGNPGGLTSGIGGGGGGFSQAGAPGSAGKGGNGGTFSTTGTSATYAGGGGGSYSGGGGGTGGGGVGYDPGGPQNNATYYGSGGGGSWDYGNAGAGAGYQGIVVVRYPYG